MQKPIAVGRNLWFDIMKNIEMGIPVAKKANSGKCEVESFDPEKVAAAKSGLLPEKQARLMARGFQALGHPARLRLLHALQGSELCVCDLAQVLGLSISTVSHHLKKLRTAEIVTFRTESRMAYYSLERTAWIKYLTDATRKLAQVHEDKALA